MYSACVIAFVQVHVRREERVLDLFGWKGAQAFRRSQNRVTSPVGPVGVGGLWKVAEKAGLAVTAVSKGGGGFACEV